MSLSEPWCRQVIPRCLRVETTPYTAIGADGCWGPRVVYQYSDWYARGRVGAHGAARSAVGVVATIELITYETRNAATRIGGRRPEGFRCDAPLPA
jgi:hypothetical protein